MKVQPLSLQLPGTSGSVSAECFTPQKSKCVITLAHGAGAGMQHVFMTTLAYALAEYNIATLRFNFPFIENKKGRPDTPAVAHQTIEAAITKAQNLFKKLPLFVAGKSFGGRMSSQYLSTHQHTKAKGIIFYGFPLHPQGKPSVERAEHLKDIQLPMLFLQGTKDALAEWKLIEAVCTSLSNTVLVKIEGADHSFKAGKQNIIQLLADKTNDWIEEIIS